MTHLNARSQAMSSWFAATAQRHSRRAYSGGRVDAPVLDTLAATCEGFRPFDDARVVLLTDPSVDVFTGVVGAYGKVTGATHVIAMVTDGGSKTADQHAGYAGEAAVLEATALGLDTCWVGGFFDPRKVARMIDIGASERVVAVSPVGRARDGLTGTERAMSAMAASRNRKPLEVIAPGSEGWPAWARRAAECVRNAPSAVNRQPWRLRLDSESLVIARDSAIETPKVSKALDCGIAMLHAELGAHAAGVTGSWTDARGGLDVAAFTPVQP